MKFIKFLELRGHVVFDFLVIHFFYDMKRWHEQRDRRRAYVSLRAIPRSEEALPLGYQPEMLKSRACSFTRPYPLQPESRNVKVTAWLNNAKALIPNYFFLLQYLVTGHISRATHLSITDSESSIRVKSSPSRQRFEGQCTRHAET